MQSFDCHSLHQGTSQQFRNTGLFKMFPSQIMPSKLYRKENDDQDNGYKQTTHKKGNKEKYRNKVTSLAALGQSKGNEWSRLHTNKVNKLKTNKEPIN